MFFLMSNAKGSKALKQTEAAPSHSSLPPLFSGVAGPALKQDSRLHDLSNSDPDLCSTRKIVTYKDNAGNEPTARFYRQHRLQCTFSSPEKTKISATNPEQNGYFQSRYPSLSCASRFSDHIHTAETTDLDTNSVKKVQTHCRQFELAVVCTGLSIS